MKNPTKKVKTNIVLRCGPSTNWQNLLTPVRPVGKLWVPMPCWPIPAPAAEMQQGEVAVEGWL